MSHVMRRCNDARQGEETEDCVQKSKRSGTGPRGWPEEQSQSTEDQPDRRDPGEDGDARDVIAPGLDGLVGGFEFSPDEVEEPGECGGYAKEPRGEFHS